MTFILMFMQMSIQSPAGAPIVITRDCVIEFD